jgi:hypothetical protein
MLFLLFSVLGVTVENVARAIYHNQKEDALM